MPNEAPHRHDEYGEAGLAARAAWLYFSGGMTQGQIAKRLGVTSIKAHRLIARAHRDGLVRIFVDAEVAECLELEETIRQRFGLEFCSVAPDLGEETALPLRVLGIAGANFLKNEIERGEHALIGVGHGRTLAAAVDAMPAVATGRTRFVSVLGGFTRRFAANPYDVIHRLAEKTGAEAFQIPLPTFANTAEDKAVLLSQPGVGEVFDLACSARLVFAGIGDVTEDAFLFTASLVGSDEIGEIRAGKAVGELLGHYFNAAGQPVAEAVSARALSPTLDHLRASRVVALAGGADKVSPILALLRSEFLDGLVTDEVTARAILAENAAA